MVDYPIKIPPGSEDLRAGRIVGGRGRRVGPYVKGADIYFFLLGITTGPTVGRVEVWKSSDQGETWAQQDSVNAPEIGGGSGNFIYVDAQPSYDLSVTPLIYCLYPDDDTQALRVHPFNITQDQWGIASSAGPVPTTNASTIQMTRRPVGVNQIEFPIAYPGPQDSGFDRVYYTVYRPATDAWDAGVRLFGTAIETEDYVARARTEGPASGVGQGRTHFFARQGSSDFAVGFNFVHRSAESDDVLNAQDTVTNVGEPKPGNPIVAGSEIIVPYNKGIDEVAVARGTSAATMSWSIEIVYEETDINAQLEFNREGVVSLPESKRVYFVRDPDAGGASPDTIAELYYSDDGGAGTWGAAQLVHAISDPTETLLEAFNVGNVGNTIGAGFTLRITSVEPTLQAYYTQEGEFANAGMINQVDTVSGGGYVVS
jgi:hypothetical protein